MFVHSINAMYDCVLFPARCSLSVGRMNGFKDCCVLEEEMESQSERQREPWAQGGLFYLFTFGTFFAADVAYAFGSLCVCL